MERIQYNISEISGVAARLAKDICDVSAITFTGSLGAGKTTVISALLEFYGVVEPVTSPTFAYVNIYKLPLGVAGSNYKTIYHFDLYRLKNLYEFQAAGFFEYLDSRDRLVIFEWPDIISSELLEKVCHIDLQHGEGEQERVLTYYIADKRRILK